MGLTVTPSWYSYQTYIYFILDPSYCVTGPTIVITSYYCDCVPIVPSSDVDLLRALLHTCQPIYYAHYYIQDPYSPVLIDNPTSGAGSQAILTHCVTQPSQPLSQEYAETRRGVAYCLACA